MPNYRRFNNTAGLAFFTVVANGRRPILTLVAVRRALRHAVKRVQLDYPFRIDAWVLLPDHLHCIWDLPEDTAGPAVRWSIIKRVTTQECRAIPELIKERSESRFMRRECGLWQRRFWERRIRTQVDFAKHFDYIHFNPVKHGYVARPVDWPFSTFHRYVRAGVYTGGWGGRDAEPLNEDRTGE